MMFKIEGYSYTQDALAKCAETGELDLDVYEYQPLDFRGYLTMRKSIMLAERLQKAEMVAPMSGGAPAGIKPAHEKKAKAALPSGTRWITVHPNGDNGKGVPVMIRDDGNGHAHVVGGAGGRLNMLKLNNIKSVEQYKKEADEKKKELKEKKDAEKREEQKRMAELKPEERKKLNEAKKLARNAEKEKEKAEQEKVQSAEAEFTSTIAKMMGWEDKSDEIYENYNQQREQAVIDLQNAIDTEDPEQIKAAKKAVKVLDKAYEQAMKSYQSNMRQAAKSAIKEIQREAIEDETIRAELEARIGDKTRAEEIIQTENGGTSKGFVTGYRESAQEKGDLSQEDLAKEKEEQWQKTLERVGQDNPQLAVMLEAGLETRKAISETKKEIYQQEQLKARVKELDDKAEAMKKYLAYKKALEEKGSEKTSAKKYTQKTIDGEDVKDEDVADTVRGLTYGDGLNLGDEISVEDFTKSLEDEAARIEADRQAATNKSLLDAIQKNPNGVEKWIANGRYTGINQLSLSVLKAETLSRDVTDILGLRGSAQLMAQVMRQSLSPEDYEIAAEAVGRYHAATNESVVTKALEQSYDIIAKADSLQREIDRLEAENPDDLLALDTANKTRLRYMDEANRILGQALGSLEASAALVSELQRSGKLREIDANLGAISSEDAIVRARALGLDREDYEIDTVNGDRILTVKESGVDKLATTVDPEDVAIENDVDAIKSGAFDEDGWLPDGVVSRTVDSFEDPGVDASIPAEDVDNQSIGDDAASFKGAQEAAHRALGEMPEGAMAFKKVEDLTPQEQTDLRRYYENSVYKGTMADAFSMRGYQGDKEAYASKSGSWQKHLAESGGEVGAYEAIKADMLARAPENLMGTKEVPTILKIDPDNAESFREKLPSGDYAQRIDGVHELYAHIDELQLAVENKKEGAKEALALAQEELPGNLKELYQKQLREHYYKWMSGLTEQQLQASGERFEQSPWKEYVRMHGSVERAQAAILDTIKGQFIEKFAANYGKTAKVSLKTKREKIAEHKGHLMGTLGKEDRDSIQSKIDAERQSAQGAVQNRKGGKFDYGSVRDKALDEMKRRQDDLAGMADLFGEDTPKQDDGTERVSIGKRAEEQLASMMPDLSQNLRRGEKFGVFAGMSMHGKHVQQQRAVKMFERVKRMNLTFGTGKGKSITSIGAFTNLKAKGMAKRAVFAVPSVVQKQFGGEVNRYLEPGKYKSVADPSLDREARIAAMKDPKNDMVVFTHQSLRDDLVYLMSQRMGKDEEAAKEAFNAMKPEERKAYLGETLKENGIAFDMLTVDESHYLVNRKGKDDSTTSNVMDALNQTTPYFMNQSATPIKNDASEAFDFLRKVAPDKFKSEGREEFIKRYGVDTAFSRDALRKLINRYNYSSPTETGVKKNETRESIKLTPEQQTAYNAVTDAFRRASRANKAGGVDVEAMKVLSPNSFKDVPEEKHEELAKRLQSAAGTIKEEAYSRVVNSFDPEKNAKVSRLMDIVESKRYEADHPKTGSKKGDRAPGVVFAHNLASVDAVAEAMRKKGMRIGVITGAMSGDEKEKVKVGFNPAKPEDRQYDVIVLSDAGATGLNLQNAKYLVNYDLPQTSWVVEQRNGRLDRNGQAHDEIDYHILTTETDHEDTKWERVQRKKKLGEVFQQDPGSIDDSGVSSFIAAVRQERYNQGEERRSA